jgi:hypothetical protein
MSRLAVCVLAMALICTACQQPYPRLNAPPHGTTDNPSPLQDTYAYMVDNALLEDMSITDAHFLPHRPGLNSLGEERLGRLAVLLEIYGGTIRFDSALTDKDLVDARVAAIRACLAEKGIDTTKEMVCRDLAGGSGMDAPQAILIKANEATYHPKEKQGNAAPPPAYPSR